MIDRLRALISRNLPPRISKVRELLKGKSGLEIAGPSPIFSKKGELSIYPWVKNLDGCNFSTETLWQGKIKNGRYFEYESGKPPGHQYICEATDLKSIGSQKYDFVLCSHALEHMANPMKALSEWLRVIKDAGLIVLVLPFKEGCFDHRRRVTPFAHLLDDFKNEIGEDDLTHLEEILKLHDLSRDPEAGNFEKFKELSRENFKYRRLHHHVFDETLIHRVFRFLKLKPMFFKRIPPFHLIAVGQK